MDEHSQAGRPFWSWFKLHHEEFRRPAQLTDDAMNTIFDESINFNLPIQTYNCPWGGIPFIYFFGDCSQLPPVMMKSLFDESPGSSGSTDMHARTVKIEFFDFPNNSVAESTSDLMNQVLRQDDISFLNFLSNLRNGSVNDDDVNFLLCRCLDRLSEQEHISFDNALHLVPVWSMTEKVIYDHLMSFDIPICKIKPKYKSILLNGKKSLC